MDELVKELTVSKKISIMRLLFSSKLSPFFFDCKVDGQQFIQMLADFSEYLSKHLSHTSLGAIYVPC